MTLCGWRIPMGHADGSREPPAAGPGDGRSASAWFRVRLLEGAGSLGYQPQRLPDRHRLVLWLDERDQGERRPGQVPGELRAGGGGLTGRARLRDRGVLLRG